MKKTLIVANWNKQIRQTYGFSHRADKMEYILAGLLFSLNAGVNR